MNRCRNNRRPLPERRLTALCPQRDLSNDSQTRFSLSTLGPASDRFALVKTSAMDTNYTNSHRFKPRKLVATFRVSEECHLGHLASGAWKLNPCRTSSLTHLLNRKFTTS